MKRIALVLLVLSAGAMLPGCPIYGSDEGCVVDADCPQEYVCDGTLGFCELARTLSCTTPLTCASNETCSADGICKAGDCSWPDIGCVSGYRCAKESGIWECVRATSGSGGSGAGGAENSGGAPGGAGGAT